MAYAEPIRIDRRIRDLEQGRDGRIVLRTDEGDIVVLSRTVREPVGERLYERCSRCHEPVSGGAGLGPSLRGTLGRLVASERGYVYSAALTRLGGPGRRNGWTRFCAIRRRMRRELRWNSRAFSDAAERKALIEFLEQYR